MVWHPFEPWKQEPCESETIITALQIGNLKLREVKWFLKGYTTGKSQKGRLQSSCSGAVTVSADCWERKRGRLVRSGRGTCVQRERGVNTSGAERDCVTVTATHFVSCLERFGDIAIKGIVISTWGCQGNWERFWNEQKKGDWGSCLAHPSGLYLPFIVFELFYYSAI